jgi:hypothetical protein
MNAFMKLKFHLDRHIYKRGRNKGEAPADSCRRGKSFFRVLKGNDNSMRVRMHNTDIITAYEDGSIMVSTGGWWTATTRANLNDALRWFVPEFISVSGRLVFGMRQPTITANNKTYLFYDGIRFDGEGNLLSTPMPFERKRKDKAETAEFRDDLAKSGFKDAFPLLYQSAEPSDHTWIRNPLHKTMRDESHTDDWRTVTALIKYPSYGNRLYNKPAHDDWRDAWKVLNARATKDMTETVRTDVIVL